MIQLNDIVRVVSKHFALSANPSAPFLCDTQYEDREDTARILLTGFAMQYEIPAKTVKSLLCVEDSYHENMLEQFKQLVRDGANQQRNGQRSLFKASENYQPSAARRFYTKWSLCARALDRITDHRNKYRHAA